MNLRPLLFLPPLALGIGAYMWLTSQGPSDPVTPPESVTVVRTMKVAPSSAVPFAVGYGRVEAEESWSAISQVQGRAVMVADNLDVGSVFQSDTEIIRIDPRDYEIALARATASRNSAQAALDELEATEANTRAAIELEARIEKIRRDELTRQETLLERGSVAQKSVDTAVRELLAQEKMVLNLENTLRLLPAQRASLQATIDTRIVEIEEAERALANTVITSPLTGRVTSTSVANGQFVRVGDTLAIIESTRASEVVAQFQTRLLGNLFATLETSLPAELVAQVDAEDAFVTLKQFNLQAEVALNVGQDTYRWPAELVRFDGSVDPTTGTVGLVVRIENPGLPDPNRRGPPLTNGTFVEVKLAAPDPIEALRIPRSAIHTDQDAQFVYLVGEESRLVRQEIETSSVQDDLVVVRNGLKGGETLVLSDPRPAVIGMLLEPAAASGDRGL